MHFKQLKDITGAEFLNSHIFIYMQEMGIPDHLICLLRNLYACQEETVRTGHGTH